MSRVTQPILDEDGLLDVYVSSEGGTAYAYAPGRRIPMTDVWVRPHIVIDPDFAAETDIG